MTKKKVKRGARKRKAWSLARARGQLTRWYRKAALNGPVAVLGALEILALESFSAGGIYQTVIETVIIGPARVPLAAIQVTISLCCGWLSLAGNVAAETFKADPRPEQAKRAGGARFLALALAGAPIWFLGGAFGEQIAIAKSNQALHSSTRSGYEDIVHATAGTYDGREVLEAQAELAKGDRPLTPPLEDFAPGLVGAAILYAMAILSTSTFWRVKAETPAQARSRTAEVAAKAEADRKAASTAKGQATKAANLALKNAGFTPAGTGKKFQLWRNVA